jgi:hypothetical protein
MQTKSTEARGEIMTPFSARWQVLRNAVAVCRKMSQAQEKCRGDIERIILKRHATPA